MALKIIETADGSSSFYNETLDETYHSRHGAIQEAEHVFLKMGLLEAIKQKNKIDLLEMGFGTGLNAWLTALLAQRENINVHYTGVEAFPLSKENLALVNYASQKKVKGGKELLSKIHNAVWEVESEISAHFYLIKQNLYFEEINFKNCFDLIYFDAFGPRVQPDLWSENIFSKMFTALRSGGLLTTYSAKGDARRAMIASGFEVKKVPGPPGKREMLIARKNG